MKSSSIEMFVGMSFEIIVVAALICEDFDCTMNDDFSQSMSNIHLSCHQSLEDRIETLSEVPKGE